MTQSSDKMRITVGLPVYQGAAQIGEALSSLQRQTHKNFDVIVSVDNNDLATANECRPYLADSRFRLQVQDRRLDWNGNLNWLLQQEIGDYFCYRQHDDFTTDDYFERLLSLSAKRPEAAIVYTDCQWIGGRNDIEVAPELDGNVYARMRRFIEEKQPGPVRGLIRKAAVAQAGLIRIDEFRGLSEVFVWLAKVLRWGPFLRLPEPLYMRRDHAENYHKQWHDWPDVKKREAWATLFTGLLEAVDPICVTHELKALFELLILERVAIRRPGRSFHYRAPLHVGEGSLVQECYARLRKEGLGSLSVLRPMMADIVHCDGVPQREGLAEYAARFGDSEYRGLVPPDFSAEDYLLLNPDVLAARMDPYLHYTRFGAREGRTFMR